jgi:hypothetical protein
MATRHLQCADLIIFEVCVRRLFSVSAIQPTPC